jgi:hypothetical protein
VGNKMDFPELGQEQVVKKEQEEREKAKEMVN